MSPTIDEILRGLEDVPCHDTAPPSDLPSEAPPESGSQLAWIGRTAADRSGTIDGSWQQQQRVISPEPEVIYGAVAAAATRSVLTGQVGDADHNFGPPARPETNQGSGAE